MARILADPGRAEEAATYAAVVPRVSVRRTIMVTNRPGTLLLVEDEHRLRDLVAQFLRGEGFRVVEACDGPEGVERFTDSGPFDLVLVDLNLPVFSGVEVCRRIKSARPDQRMMVCSAAIVADHERTLREVGVGHYLTKPYHPEALLDHIAQEIGPWSDFSTARTTPRRAQAV
jgi:CheY-like chemotaxis protein